MWYAELRKRVRLIPLGTISVPGTELFCQFNPDYIDAWLAVTPESYHLVDSPHMGYLTGDARRYREMYRAYGRDERWIDKKEGEYCRLRDEFLAAGHAFWELPELLMSPIIVNPYNQSRYEIWEGHHRCAISARYTGKVTCRLNRWEILNDKNT